MYDTYISIPNKQFWFSLEYMNEDEQKDPNFNIENYWLARYQNEYILDVTEHGKRPLTQLSKLMAYAQLTKN